MVHKALNPIHPPLMGPGASESSLLRPFADASDASGEATLVRLLSGEDVGRRTDCASPTPTRAHRCDLSFERSDASRDVIVWPKLG